MKMKATLVMLLVCAVWSAALAHGGRGGRGGTHREGKGGTHRSPFFAAIGEANCVASGGVCELVAVPTTWGTRPACSNPDAFSIGTCVRPAVGDTQINLCCVTATAATAACTAAGGTCQTVTGRPQRGVGPCPVGSSPYSVAAGFRPLLCSKPDFTTWTRSICCVPA